MTRVQARKLLDQLGVRPKKALGQHFLTDRNILRIIMEQADVRADETIVEIGPGLGVLTRELAAAGRRLIAIEKDTRLCAYLRQEFPEIELIEGDAVTVLESVSRDCPGSFILPPSWKVVANLPYNISSAVLWRLARADPKPRTTVVTVQREVAQRLAASPGGKDYGALTVLTQLYYQVTIAHVISPGCFYPQPKVESALVVLNRRDPRVKLEPGAPFREIVRLGFGQRRKMLRKLIAGWGDVQGAFARAGVAPNARGEQLSLEQWISLANSLR